MALAKSRSLLTVVCLIVGCTFFKTITLFAQAPGKNKALHELFASFYEERLKLFPLEATSQGDPRYNDLLPNDGSAEHLKAVHDFYVQYQNDLKKFNDQKLGLDDRISLDILLDFLSRQLGSEKFHPEYLSINQMYSLPLTMGQLGSGTSSQPFKTIADYENWLKRISAFTVWVDTAIANHRKGIQAGMVLPRANVMKIIPQMQSLAQRDLTRNVFYGPVTNLPKEFPENEKIRLTNAYKNAIFQQLIPAFEKLAGFFSSEYFARARTTSGISVLPDGDAMYRHYINFYTTTNKTPDEIYKTGLKEVGRITSEIERIKKSIGFNGSNKELFGYMKTEVKFMPFRTNAEVLKAYDTVLAKIKPHLSKYFSITPKTAFEIREVESFRAASSPPHYRRPSFDGTRPGIFYVPIVDPTKINVTGWAMESLFIHEAIPGHHFQLALQQENNDIPQFRRTMGNSAFIEGWGLYAESLGEKLGCYTDPYQKLGALGNEIHRAIRLVVDVALHTGEMNREQAIAYMLEHEALGEAEATLEIERYMALPGQALSYKTGELKIKELRDKYQKKLGSKFSLKDFHDTILKGGAMPLNVLEKYLELSFK
ncbi:MAG: DUF885 domain-containing protein [Cyclobacteriaceae bacterium]